MQQVFLDCVVHDAAYSAALLSDPRQLTGARTPDYGSAPATVGIMPFESDIGTAATNTGAAGDDGPTNVPATAPPVTTAALGVISSESNSDEGDGRKIAGLEVCKSRTQKLVSTDDSAAAKSARTKPYALHVSIGNVMVNMVQLAPLLP